MGFQLPTKSPLIPKEGYLSLHWYLRLFPPTAGWRSSSGSPLGFQGSLSEWEVLGVPCYCLHSGLHWSHQGVGGLITTEQRHKICLSLGLLWYHPSRQGGREVPHCCWLGSGNPGSPAQWSRKRDLLLNCKDGKSIFQLGFSDSPLCWWSLGNVITDSWEWNLRVSTL